MCLLFVHVHVDVRISMDNSTLHNYETQSSATIILKKGTYVAYFRYINQHRYLVRTNGSDSFAFITVIPWGVNGQWIHHTTKQSYSYHNILS